MTTTNLALIGGVVVLLLVMLKLRRDKASTGGSTSAKRAKAPKAPRGVKLPKSPRRRAAKPAGDDTQNTSGRRLKGRTRTAPVTTGPAGDWPEPAETAATTEPQTEPDWDAMRADVTGPREAPAMPEIIPNAEAPAWEPGDVVTAPGWPLPGEVDVSWDASTSPGGDGGDASGTWRPTETSPDLNAEVSDWLGSEDDAVDTATTPEADADASWDALVPADLAAQALAETQITGEAPSWLSDDEVPVTTPAWESTTPDWSEFSEEAAPVADEAEFAQAVMASAPEVAATIAPEQSWLGADTSQDVFEIASPDTDLDLPEPETDAPEWRPAAEPADWTTDDDTHGVAAEPLPRVAMTVEEAASDLTGRFALGGFAVETGHTALSSAMFRGPLVTVPTRWSIANGSDYAPGTIVLHVEATLNCEASDLEVALESAFAPTAYGATLRLAAGGPGPFAASGTFQLIP